MLALSGTGIGHRVAIGKAMVLDRSHQEIPKYEVSKDQVQSEIERFQSALARTRAELRRIQQEIPDHAPQETNAFIDVHLLMLQDPVIAEQPVRAMEEHSYNAEWALKIQADTLVKFFRNIEDPYLRSKKDDVHQVVNRILDELMMENDPPAAALDGNLAGRVVIANDLTPADTITLHHRGITAFVTSLGGPISHTAILARSLGIPAVVGLHHAVQYIQNGDLLAVDVDIIIVSGLSGSGKSVALHSLEDLGYYCTDNLPAAPLSQFLNQFKPMANGHAEHAAVSIDSQNRQFLTSLPNSLAQRRKIGQPARIVFLEATDETLLQCYSETRRKHPLTDTATPLLDGIAVERTLLAPLE